MIGFDNGPEDGDFVRYIDALLATRAAAPLASVREFDPKSALTTAPRRDPPIPSVGASSIVAPGASKRREPIPSASRVPGTTLTPAQAASIAAAMIRDGGSANLQTWVAVASLLLGVALMVGGWIGAAFSAPLVFVGGALAYWAVRRLVESTRGTAIRKR